MNVDEIILQGNDVGEQGEVKIRFNRDRCPSPLSFTFTSKHNIKDFAIHDFELKRLLIFLFENIVKSG